MLFEERILGWGCEGGNRAQRALDEPDRRLQPPVYRHDRYDRTSLVLENNARLGKPGKRLNALGGGLGCEPAPRAAVRAEVCGPSGLPVGDVATVASAS